MLVYDIVPLFCLAVLVSLFFLHYVANDGVNFGGE